MKRMKINKIKIIKNDHNDGSTGLVVMGDDSGLRGRGYESSCHILDGHDMFSH